MSTSTLFLIKNNFDYYFKHKKIIVPGREVALNYNTNNSAWTFKFHKDLYDKWRKGFLGKFAQTFEK